MISYGSSPLSSTVPPDWADKVLHTTLTLPGGSGLLGTDVVPGSFKGSQGFLVLLTLSGTAEAERLFSELAKDGTAKVPLQKTFWSPCFGVVVDRFGIPWDITID